jgi:hypothetical protein
MYENETIKLVEIVLGREEWGDRGGKELNFFQEYCIHV